MTKFGAILPIFSESLPNVLTFTERAEEFGLDGVFAFDHLADRHDRYRSGLAWAPTLGAIAGATSELFVGTLVARVGVIPNRLLEYQFLTLHQLLGDRLIAGLGIGDKLSDPEDAEYGVARPPRADRLNLVTDLSEKLRSQGIRTWLGGRSEEMREQARAHADGMNVWSAPADELDDPNAPGRFDVTWAAALDRSEKSLQHLRDAVAKQPDWIIVMPRGFADWQTQLKELLFFRDEIRR